MYAVSIYFDTIPDADQCDGDGANESGIDDKAADKKAITIEIDASPLRALLLGHSRTEVLAMDSETMANALRKKEQTRADDIWPLRDALVATGDAPLWLMVSPGSLSQFLVGVHSAEQVHKLEQSVEREDARVLALYDAVQTKSLNEPLSKHCSEFAERASSVDSVVMVTRQARQLGPRNHLPLTHRDRDAVYFSALCTPRFADASASYLVSVEQALVNVMEHYRSYDATCSSKFLLVLAGGSSNRPFRVVDDNFLVAAFEATLERSHSFSNWTYSSGVLTPPAQSAWLIFMSWDASFHRDAVALLRQNVQCTDELCVLIEAPLFDVLQPRVVADWRSRSPPLQGPDLLSRFALESLLATNDIERVLDRAKPMGRRLLSEIRTPMSCRGTEPPTIARACAVLSEFCRWWRPHVLPLGDGAIENQRHVEIAATEDNCAVTALYVDYSERLPRLARETYSLDGDRAEPFVGAFEQALPPLPERHVRLFRAAQANKLTEMFDDVESCDFTAQKADFGRGVYFSTNLEFALTYAVEIHNKRLDTNRPVAILVVDLPQEELDSLNTFQVDGDDWLPVVQFGWKRVITKAKQFYRKIAAPHKKEQWLSSQVRRGPISLPLDADRRGDPQFGDFRASPFEQVVFVDGRGVEALASFWAPDGCANVYVMRAPALEKTQREQNRLRP